MKNRISKFNMKNRISKFNMENRISKMEYGTWKKENAIRKMA